MTHVYIHTGEKPIKYQVCNEYFNQNSHFTIHMRTHMVAKLYECGVCRRLLSNGNALNKHSGENQFEYHVCLKSFIQNGSLTRHL